MKCKIRYYDFILPIYRVKSEAPVHMGVSQSLTLLPATQTSENISLRYFLLEILIFQDYESHMDMQKVVRASCILYRDTGHLPLTLQ